MSERLDIEYCRSCDDVYATYPQVWLSFDNLLGETTRVDELTFQCPRCYLEIERHEGFIDSLKKRDDPAYLDGVIENIMDLTPEASNLLRLLLGNFTVPSFAVHLTGTSGLNVLELIKKRYIESTKSSDTNVFFVTLNALKLGLYDNEEILQKMGNQRSFLLNPGYLKSNSIQTERRKSRHEALVDDFTGEERASMFEYFGNVCALTGADIPLQVDHVLPLAIGHGGTTLPNMLPIGQRLNSSKGAKNIFEWYEENGDRFEVLPELFDKAIEYLAELNEMTTQEYRDYVYECHANPNDILTEVI